MDTIGYIQGAELPDAALAWTDSGGNLIDFSTGHDFELLVGEPGQAASLSKTSGITGDDADPNVTIAWGEGELDDLAVGSHTCHLIATRTSDGKERVFPFRLLLKAAVQPVA